MTIGIIFYLQVSRFWMFTHCCRCVAWIEMYSLVIAAGCCRRYYIKFLCNMESMDVALIEMFNEKS